MTYESKTADLQAAIRKAEEELATLETERKAAHEEWQQAQKMAADRYERKIADIDDRENTIEVTRDDARWDLNRAIVNDIITAHDGLSKEGLAHNIETCLRRKHGHLAAKEITDALEDLMIEDGFNPESIDVVICRTGTDMVKYQLTATEYIEVVRLLNHHCPRHPEYGYLLPTWTV